MRLGMGMILFFKCLLILPFAVVTVMARDVSRWMRYGRSVFEMPSVPAPVDRELSGRVLAGNILPGHSIRVNGEL